MSGAGKGPRYRPVRLDRWSAGWYFMTIDCPACGRGCLRSNTGKIKCPKCGHSWKEKTT